MDQSQEMTPSRQYNDEGYLIVRAFTAGGFIPLENARVTVRGGDTNNRDYLLETTTDRSGATKIIPLPAPSPQLSLDSASVRPYATYIVEVAKDLFNTYRDENVTVFADITSLQSANMIPTSMYRPEENRPNDALLTTRAQETI